jgi:hypothetical protein
MPKVTIRTDVDQPEPYFVEVTCPGCGNTHGLPETTLPAARETAALLEMAPRCLDCVAKRLGNSI